MGRVVHRLHPGSTHRARYVATCGYETYPHNPQDLLLLLFFSLEVINKEKTGAVSLRASGASPRRSDGRARMSGLVRTLYGDEQRLVRLRGDVRSLAAPRVWKGLS